MFMWPNANAQTKFPWPSRDSLNFVQTVLWQQKWRIINERQADAFFEITAVPPSTIRHWSQVRIEIKENSDHSTIEFQFTFTRAQFSLLSLALLLLTICHVAALQAPDLLGVTNSNIVAAGSTAFIVLLAYKWTNSDNEVFLKKFYQFVHNETGETVQYKEGVSSIPGAPWLISYAFFLLFHVNWLIFISPMGSSIISSSSWRFGMPQMSMILLILSLLLFAANGGRKVLRTTYGLYIGAAYAVMCYMMYPAFYQLFYEVALRSENPLAMILGAPSFVPIISAYCTTAMMLALVNQALNTIIKQSHEYMTSDISPSPTMGFRIAGKCLIAAIWIAIIISEYRAVIEIWKRFQPIYFWQMPRTERLSNVLWSLPIIVLLGFLLWRSIRNTFILRKQIAMTPPTWSHKVATLSRRMKVVPKVAWAQDGTTHAFRHFFYGPVIVLTAREVKELTDEEQSALILHELCHIQADSRIFQLLDGLSVISLCGKGLLGMLMETKAIEIDADLQASDKLTSEGLNGHDVVESMLSKMQHTNRNRHQSKSLMLLDIFLGDDGRWYEHPSYFERLEALRTHHAGNKRDRA